MGESPSVDGGLDDPHRVWRRPAPGDSPEPAAAPTWVPSTSSDPERAIWGPEADTAPPSVAAPAAPPAAWFPASPPTPDPIASAPPADRRWEPTLGGAVDSWTSGGPPNAAEIGIDERPAPPARQPTGEQFGTWWARAGIVAAVIAVVIVAVAIASGSDPDGDAATATSVTRSSTTTTSVPRSTTTAPTTSTTGGPASTNGPAADPADLAAEDDPRVMLTDLPEGYAPVRAQLLLDHSIGGLVPGLLFVTDDSTWHDGPWVIVSGARDASFVGPTVAGDVGGGRTARIGVSDVGAELVALDAGDGSAMVAVSAKGLPAGTAGAIAAALAVGGDESWSVPATALPAGLRPATGDLADSLFVRPASSAMVNYRGPGGVGVTVQGTLADPGYDPLALAPFFLSDVAYVHIDGASGIMGTYRAAYGSITSLQWRQHGVDIELTAWGMAGPDLLEVAAQAATRADGGWSERTWQAAEDSTGVLDAPEPVRIGPPLDFGGEGGGAAMAQRNGSSVSWWIDGSAGFSIGRYGQDAPPVVLHVASNAVPAIELDGASYVVALALGDASIEGATLRVRSGSTLTGGDGIGHDNSAIVHSIEPAADDAGAGSPSEFGYALGAAVSVPWPEGEFVAELIAADGSTVLATATRADLL